MAESGGSRRIWLDSPSDEESRDYLQQRLAVMSKLMFWSFVLLLGFMGTIYAAFPVIEPRLNKIIYAISAVGIVLLAVIWRVLLVRRKLTIRQLQGVDMFLLFGTGAIFGASGALAYDLRPSAYVCLTFSCLLVLLRATVVPSSPRRTRIVSTIACLPMATATVVLVYIGEQDVPGPAYVGGAVLTFGLSISLASIGSNVLYGLRREISKAVRLGQYTLSQRIGKGGNGIVYRAHHAMLRRPTAIKVMNPDKVNGDTLDRFEREVQHMSQLTHANTCAVFDYGRSHDGVFYYAMEYLDGIDLEHLVRQYGAQPAARVVPILIQVCGALQEAHTRGLIHRDVKPANILLCERGGVPDVAKVVDFGLVKEFAVDKGTTSPHVMGTPAYIAPETITAPREVGAATDLYALGAVAYFLLTGSRVFEAENAMAVMVKHVSDSPRSLSEASPHPIPPALETIVMQCLAKSPKQRPASATALAKALRNVSLDETWSEDKASAWWREFRREPAITEPEGRPAINTITIDLGIRA